ncbi:MAG: DUF5130 family protein [Pseudonocardiaceae bacterium]
MATGNEQPADPARRDHSQGDGYQRELALGEALVGTGRISAARQIRPVLPQLPFSRSQLAKLDDVLVRASRSASVHFGIYLGDLGLDTRTRAEELHDSLGEWADDAVLVAVSPGQRVVEVVTGCKAANRLPDRGCKLAVESMVSSFKDGDLAGGLSSGLRMLADHTES